MADVAAAAVTAVVVCQHFPKVDGEAIIAWKKYEAMVYWVWFAYGYKAEMSPGTILACSWGSIQQLLVLTFRRFG